MYKKIVLVWVLSFMVLTAQAKQLLDKVVAIVNDSVITSSELEKQVILAKKQLLAQRLEIPSDTELRKQALNYLINVDLQLQMAKQTGISVDESELTTALERIAATNQVTLSQMREELTRQGMVWDEYRESIRKEMILSHLQQKAVGRDILITNEQVEQYLKVEGNISIDRANVTYHLHNLIVPLNEHSTSEQIKKAYADAAHLFECAKKGADFIQLASEKSTAEVTLESGDLGMRRLAELPELFAKEVITMNVGEVSRPLRAGNGYQLIKLVALAGGTQQHTVTMTHARHILFKPDASMLPEDAKKQVTNIYQQLKAGKDFATMAQKYSLDTVSASKGGDLGWISPGETVSEFEKAMDKLPLNQVSEPVQTQFGWHLIEVLERKQQNDSAVFKKQQVRQFLHQRKFSEAVQNWQQHIRADAYINIVEKELA